jgi:hypothetical protein
LWNPRECVVKAGVEQGKDPKATQNLRTSGHERPVVMLYSAGFHMPILVRPVREQLEHDRVIRLLQAKYKRKYDVGMNVGAEQAVPVGTGAAAVYPDLVLQSAERSKKLLGVVEVETGESVNNLEAMSQWVALGRLRAPFHLYVPSSMIDVARRLCQDMHVPVAEVWTYHPVGDQMRFTLVQRDATVPAERTSLPEPVAAAGLAAPDAPRAEPTRAARAGTGAQARSGAARRPTAASGARRKPAAKTRTVKSAPTRGRATAAKKKSTTPARPARTQKRK